MLTELLQQTIPFWAFCIILFISVAIQILLNVSRSLRDMALVVVFHTVFAIVAVVIAAAHNEEAVGWYMVLMYLAGDGPMFSISVVRRILLEVAWRASDKTIESTTTTPI